MYGNEVGQALSIGGQDKVSRATRNTTVAENIDNRIEQLEEQVARLKAVKTKLSSGSILDVSLDDLAMAMGRY